MVMRLIDTTTESNGNEKGILHFLKSKTGASPSDAL